MSKLGGYSLDELVIFAEACRNAGVSEEDLYTFVKHAKYAYQYGMKKMQESWQYAITSAILFGDKENPYGKKD